METKRLGGDASFPGMCQFFGIRHGLLLCPGSRASGLEGEVGIAWVSQTPQTLPSASKDWAQAVRGQS